MKSPLRNGRYLPPWLLQMLGIVTFVGAAVFWAVTDHESVLIMGAAMALIGLGAYSGIHVSIQQDWEDQVAKGEKLEELDRP